jgi:hypothetical protein
MITDLPLIFHPAATGARLVLVRSRTFYRPQAEFPGFAQGDTEAAHDMVVDAFERRGDRRVGLGQREEGLPPQPPEYAGLGEADAVLDLCLLSSPGLQFVLTLKCA